MWQKHFYLASLNVIMYSWFSIFNPLPCFLRHSSISQTKRPLPHCVGFLLLMKFVQRHALWVTSPVKPEILGSFGSFQLQEQTGPETPTVRWYAKDKAGRRNLFGDHRHVKEFYASQSSQENHPLGWDSSLVSVLFLLLSKHLVFTPIWNSI